MPTPLTESSTAGAKAATKLGVFLLLVAALFDVEPLYVTAVALLVLGVGCRAWVASGARGVQIRRTLAAARVIEDDSLSTDIVLSSTRVALPSCMVEDPMLEAPVAVGGGRRVATVHVEARFPRRGRKELPPPTAIVRDPLGLARRVIRDQRIGPHDEVLVLPRVERIALSPDSAGGAGAIARRTRPGVAAAAEIDMDGLRPHREGAPASRIHWPALARTGELLERRLRPEGDTRPLVLLDARGGSEEQLDAAVRAAASLTVHLAELGGCALLLPGEHRPTPLEAGLSGWPHLHARLAVVESGGVPGVAGLAQRRGAIFYVAARPMNRIPPVLAHAPASGRVLVVPGTLAGKRSSFTVAGCTGYDLAPARPRAKKAAA